MAGGAAGRSPTSVGRPARILRRISVRRCAMRTFASRSTMLPKRPASGSCRRTCGGLLLPPLRHWTPASHNEGAAQSCARREGRHGRIRGDHDRSPPGADAGDRGSASRSGWSQRPPRWKPYDDGPEAQVVRRPGEYWVLPPPVDRAAAEKAYGAPLGDDVWNAIVAAFKRFGFDRDALAAAPRINTDRKDARSYPAGRARARKKLGDALAFVTEFKADPVARAICIAALGRTGAAQSGGDLARHLHAAAMKLTEALAVVNAALPRSSSRVLDRGGPEAASRQRDRRRAEEGRERDGAVGLEGGRRRGGLRPCLCRAAALRAGSAAGRPTRHCGAVDPRGAARIAPTMGELPP